MPSTQTPTTFDIGSMRYRVRVQRDVGQQSPSGAIAQDWQDVTTVWAAISQEGGNEMFSPPEIYPESRTTITIRYYPGIDTSMRVLWTDPRTQKDSQFDIKSVSDLEESRHHLLQLTCEQRPIERNA